MSITAIKCKLIGTDGNAIALVGRVSEAMRRGGRGELVNAFRAEALSGDYAHVLATCDKYVEVC